MASQSDLVKIGIEGFAIIDEFFGTKSNNNHVLPPSPPQRAPAAPAAATTFHASHPQICHYRYQPQESYLLYQPQEPITVRVTKGFATEATVVSSHQYKATGKALENMPVMDYQGPSFRRPYN